VYASWLQVSHDQMRDHVWSMLRPKHMLKWKQRHMIDYTFSFNKDVFYPQEPRPYTPCVQEVRPGVWLLPSAELTQQQQQQGQKQPQAQGWAGAAGSEGAERSQDKWLLIKPLSA
jgi:hypothetical protein